MKGWEVRKLGEVVKLEYGKPLPQEDRAPNGANPAFGANGVLCWTNRFYHDRPSFIIGRKGSAGEINLTPPKFWPLDVTYFVTFDEQKYDLMFLFHAFQFLDLPSLAKGVKPGINRNDVYDLSFAFPPLDEQRRTVAVLDEAFAGLAVMRANAEANLKNARALFDSHLNAIFSQKGEGWVETTMGKAGRLQTGTTPKSSEAGMKGDFIPFIKPGDFAKDGSLDYQNEGLTEAGLASSRLIAAGSALMVCIGATIGKAGFSTRQIAANQQINSFTPNTGIDGKFVFYQMLTDRFQSAVMHSSGQATLPIINKSKWGALSICRPKSYEEQILIVETLDGLMAEIGSLESLYRQKLAAIDELKQSLLQKAFAGELTSAGIAA